MFTRTAMRTRTGRSSCCSLLVVLWCFVHQLCIIAADDSSNSTATSPSPPRQVMWMGRSTAGTWRGVPYELIYYVTITELSGPFRKKSCLKQSIEAVFSEPSPPQISTLTLEQEERVLADVARAAEMKHAEQADREFRKEERKRIAPDGRIHYGPIPRIGDQYHTGAFWYSPQKVSARASLIYNYDGNLAVYLNGTYIDTHKSDKVVLAVSPITDEFEDFVEETVSPLIAISASKDVDPRLISDISTRCIADLGTDIWDPKEDQTLFGDTTIFGSQASGVWQQKDNISATGDDEPTSYSYEIVSFLEFFRITPKLTETMATCFYELVSLKFFVPDEVLEDGTYITSRLPPDQLNSLRQLSNDEEAKLGMDEDKDDSIFWKFSLGSLGSSGFSVQHGAGITLDGKIVQSRSELPTGFEDFMSSMMNEMLATPFDMQDSMDQVYEQDTIRDSNDLLMLLGGWMGECQYPRDGD